MKHKKTSFWFSPKGYAAVGLIAAVSYFLLMEHRQHLFEWLPFIILILCPFMHLFMHGDHDAHGSHDHNDNAEKAAYQKGLEDGKRKSSNKNRFGE